MCVPVTGLKSDNNNKIIERENACEASKRDPSFENDTFQETAVYNFWVRVCVQTLNTMHCSDGTFMFVTDGQEVEKNKKNWKTFGKSTLPISLPLPLSPQNIFHTLSIRFKHIKSN